MKLITFLPIASLLVAVCGCTDSNGGRSGPAGPAHPFTGETQIIESWQGDYPVAQLRNLPDDQRDQPVGFIGDAAAFEKIWKFFRPGEMVPDIDFNTRLVLFARNTQFYNRISIGKVSVTDGVAEVLAMETMSARPIEDKVAMSLAVINRQGIDRILIGDDTIPLRRL